MRGWLPHRHIDWGYLVVSLPLQAAAVAEGVGGGGAAVR